MIPNTKVSKSQTGSSTALQTSVGIILFAAYAQGGTGQTNKPAPFSSTSLLTAAFQNGPLPDYCAYDIDESGNAAVAVLPTTSVNGSYGTVTFTGTGTSAVTAGTTYPFDHYAMLVTVTNGGTIGVAGITYTYSPDGGNTTSAPQALGTSTTLTIPNTGVSFALGTGTLVTGDSWICYTERPLMNNADIATTQTAINGYRGPWEIAVFDCQYNSGTVGLFDTWLAGREAHGQFNIALINTRYLLEPTPATESAATYAAAMATLTSGDASNRVCVGADGGHVASVLTGYNLKRPTSLFLATECAALSNSFGTDPAYVGNGPISGAQIDVNDLPNDWDEDVYQALDVLRLVTLRSFAPGGPQGVYITNGNVLAPSTSTIIWIQLLRVLNQACSVAWQVLNTQLSKGVRTVVDPVSGSLVIDERDAQSIEQLVNAKLGQVLSGQCTGVNFALNRNDNLTTPGTPVNATISVAPLTYLKGFNVVTSLVKSISVPFAGA